MEAKRPKIGLALGGGGPRGLAHIGVLKVIEENGIPIDCVAGASMGALIGAVYAAGVETERLEEIALNMDLKQTALMLAPTIARSGLIEGGRVREFIKSFVGDANIEELKIPFAAVATDINTGEEMVIDRGSVAEAVRASISVPGIFTPVRLGERFLVDGGLVNPVPISVVREMGAEAVMAVNVMVSVERNAQRIGIGGETKEGSSLGKVNSRIVNSRIAKYIQSKAKQTQIVARISDIFAREGSDKKPPSLEILTTFLADNEAEYLVEHLPSLKSKNVINKIRFGHSASSYIKNKSNNNNYLYPQIELEKLKSLTFQGFLGYSKATEKSKDHLCEISINTFIVTQDKDFKDYNECVSVSSRGSLSHPISGPHTLLFPTIVEGG